MDNTKGIQREEHSTPSLKKGKNYFLGIAINDYEKCRKLNNAVKDVEDFKALLLEKYDFDDHNMRIVPDAAARRDNILYILRGYISTLQPHDNFIFYFSGHGELDKIVNEGYWIPFEAETGAWHQYISNAEIKTYLNAMPCRHLFLIVDSCFSGASLFLSRNTKNIEADRTEIAPSRWALTAGRTELVDDGIPGTNSPFAKWLLDILKKNDKSLSVPMLCARVKELVIPNSNQTPRGEPINIKGHEGGEFVFHLTENEGQKEERVWAKALVDNDEQAYNAYLSQYRKGRYVDDAVEKLKNLAIEKAYTKALKIDEIYAYHTFINKYDDEIHPRIDEAEKRIKELENVKSAEEEIKKQKRLAEETARKEKDRLAQLDIERKKQEAEDAARKEKDRLAQLETARKKQEADDAARKENDRLAQLEIDRKKQEEATRKKQEEATRKKREADEKERQKQALIKQLEPEMVFVKGGTFKMGSNDYENEKPIHDVTLSDFNMSKYPITQKQWTAIMGNNPSRFKGDNLPVEQVSWDDIQGFLSEINKKTGKTYRLPTEAEWEFAARGGNQSKGFKYAGSNDIDKVAWYNKNSESKTHPVGEKQANELGIYDMSGNVWEWCSDWFGAYNAVNATNPKGAEKGSSRVFRGGSWDYFDFICRVALRDIADPSNRNSRLGFRVCRND